MAHSGTSDGRSDEELVQVCNHGNAIETTRAFETLYKRHKEYVVRVALRFVKDHDLALDVLQETFSFLLRKFPPTGDGLTLTAQLTTFLYPVAKNSAITLMRKTERFPPSDNWQPDDLPAPSRESGDIAQVLGDLSDERREVILLRFVDDLSLQEIAMALKIPIGTVKSRLHLAIKQLRNSAQVKEFFLL